MGPRPVAFVALDLRPVSSVVRIALTCLLLCASRLAVAAVPLLQTGDMSPLRLPFSSFTSVALDVDGNAAVLGVSTAAFRAGGGGITHVLAAGDRLPSGETVAGVGNPALGPGGCVAVRAFLVGGGSRIALQCGNALTIVASTGDAAPGGGTFAEFVPLVAIGGGSHVAFTAQVSDGTTGIFRVVAGTVVAIARTGANSPGGGTFSSLRLAGVSATGRVGFRGSVTSGRDGLFAGDGTTLKTVVLVGDVAFAGGGTFSDIGGASLNDGDVWAFRGTITNGNRSGVFRTDASLLVPQGDGVVLEGDATADAGVVFRQLPSSLVPSINATGGVAFRATLGGGEGGSAIFVAAPGVPPVRVLSSRDPVPSLGSLVRFRDPVLADDGSLVVPASVTGSGPGLFAYAGGQVTGLARFGDVTDLDDGEERFRFVNPSVRETASQAVFLGNREGVFVAGASGIRTVAFLGGATPLGGVYASFDPPASQASGVVAFGAEVKDGRASRTLVSVDGRARTRTVAATERAPGGGRFVDFFASSLDGLARPDVGPGGQIVFEATLQGTDTPRALFMRAKGRPRRVAAARLRAPGGGVYDTFGTPALLGRNQVVFVAQIDVDGARHPALFVRRGGRTRQVARAGQQAGGRGTGAIADFDPPDGGSSLLACRATLTSGGRDGVFVGTKRAFGMLIGTGDPAPGGGTFRSFGRPIVGNGDVVFLGRLNASSPPGLYRVPVNGVPGEGAPPPAVEPLLRPGDGVLGGTVAEINAIDGNATGVVAAVVDLAGAQARSAVVLAGSVP